MKWCGNKYIYVGVILGGRIRVMNESTNGFEQIYKENYSKVFVFIYNLTIDWTLTEDITQEAFLKAYKNIDSFRQESKISVWLNKIAYNLLVDIKRKKLPKLQSIDDEALSAKLTDLQKNLPKDVEKKLMSECVQSKIMLMPDNYRAPLFLDIHGYNNKEIADILDCSLDNAKIRLHRSRKQMKKILGDDCNFYYDERNVLL